MTDSSRRGEVGRTSLRTSSTRERGEFGATAADEGSGVPAAATREP
jgi:hypothetical protein